MAHITDTRAKDELRPLPDLKVVQEKYCSQEMTDKAIRFLVETRPDFIARLEEVAKAIPENFEEVLEKIIDYLDKAASGGEIEMPETYLGKIDLMFELSRRYEAAYGWAWPVRRLKPGSSLENAEFEPVPDALHFELKGKPLAENPDDPFLPLPNLELSKSSKKRGLGPELTNKILQTVYEKKPPALFEDVEASRRGLISWKSLQEIREAIQDAVAIEFPEATSDDISSLKSEMTRRLRVLSELGARNY